MSETGASQERNSEFEFYMATQTFGGEYVWLDRIAHKMGKEITYIWPTGQKKPAIPVSGLTNKILVGICRIIPGGRGLFMNILIGHFRLQTDRKVFISSPYYPIPKNATIAYIHTPSRRLTVEYDAARNKNWITRLGWPVLRAFYRHAYCSSLRNPKKLFVNSKTTSDRVKKLCDLDRDLEVVYPTQDSGEFSSGQFENFFFMPSRFTEQKNQLFIVDAFNIFLEQRRLSNPEGNSFRLVLAGSDPNKSVVSRFYFQKLKKKIDLLYEAFGSKVDLIFDADRKTVIDRYSRCYAVLYAGRHEDLGQIPIEAMMSSKPVVALDEGGMRETVQDGYNGFLVDSPKEMADKLSLLANDLGLARKMGENGRKLSATYDDPVFLKKVGLTKSD